MEYDIAYRYPSVIYFSQSALSRSSKNRRNLLQFIDKLSFLILFLKIVKTWLKNNLCFFWLAIFSDNFLSYLYLSVFIFPTVLKKYSIRFTFEDYCSFPFIYLNIYLLYTNIYIPLINNINNHSISQNNINLSVTHS